MMPRPLIYPRDARHTKPTRVPSISELVLCCISVLYLPGDNTHTIYALVFHSFEVFSVCVTEVQEHQSAFLLPSPPKPNLPLNRSSTLPIILQTTHQHFHQKRPRQPWPMPSLLLGSVEAKKTGLGLEGAIKLLRALPINVPISV